MKDTINHIYHRFNGLDYSLIGNAVYHDPQDCTGSRREMLRQQMVEKARKVFGDFDDRRAEIYFGSKNRSNICVIFAKLSLSNRGSGNVHVSPAGKVFPLL